MYEEIELFISNSWESYAFFTFNDKKDSYRPWYTLNLNWTEKYLWNIEFIWEYKPWGNAWFFPDSEYFIFSYEPLDEKENENKLMINIDWKDILEKTEFRNEIWFLINIYDEVIINREYKIDYNSIFISNKWDYFINLIKKDKQFYEKGAILFNWKVIEWEKNSFIYNHHFNTLSLNWDNYIISNYVYSWKNDLLYFYTKNQKFWPFDIDYLYTTNISDDWNLIIFIYKKNNKHYYKLIWKDENSSELQILKTYWPYDDNYWIELSQKGGNYILKYEKNWEAWDKKYTIINWNEVWIVEKVQISNRSDSYIYNKDDKIYVYIHWKEYSFDDINKYNSQIYLHRDGDGFTYEYNTKIWWKTVLNNFRIK